MTCRELYEIGKKRLIAADIATADIATTAAAAEAAVEARLFLEASCGISWHDLLANGEHRITEEQIRAYLGYIAVREKRIPLQYILGEQEFMGLSFLVTPAVLIPRQDTEVLVEEVLANIGKVRRVLDLGTGSGCVLLSILNQMPDIEGTGVDISKEALGIASQNEERLMRSLTAEKRWQPVEWIENDFLDGLELHDKQYDIIVSNPPYIPTATLPGLMAEVREHEPLLALDGGMDGLDCYRQIIDRASQHLTLAGKLFFEIGHDQATAVCKLMTAAGFHDIRVKKDMGGHDRVVWGSKVIDSELK
ncbi:MAG: peptide chain release factor N(5)-glutamine methyltransferase [Lachnospiraceae bacterium]|jgi:release factor glutamine methyltransferase|nr:peptide chain release factor N(5)-glutamine methyltransferase [Lachnospiraceae bacterium]